MTRPSRPHSTAFTVALALLALLGVPHPATAQDERTVTLEEAIELALRHSPQIAQATGAMSNAESAERTAWGAFLPSLSLSTRTSLSSSTRFNSETNTVVTSPSSQSYNAGLSSSIDLFTGGRRGAQLEQARAQTAAAEVAFVQQRFAVMLAAKRAVFDVLQADELIRIAEARVLRAREGVEAATRRMEVGSGTRSDVLRAGLELTNAQQSLLQARSQRRTAAFALGRLVGESGPVGARLTEPLQPRPLAYSREELLQLVLEQAPSVRSAVAAQRAADASVRSARAQYLPTLSASASYNLVNQEVDFRTANKSWSIGAGISYPIFNRFQREDAVARANVQADIARVQLEDAKREARAEFERVMAGLELAEQQIALAEEAVQAAEEDLRMQEERYRLGVATIIDRVTSQLNLVQAEVDRIAARYAYQLARAELEALVGRSL